MNSKSYSVRMIEDQLDGYLSIVAESLLFPDRELWQTYVNRIGRENIRGVFDGSNLAGGLAFYRMAQWFGGKEIPCGGISGVAISPDHRGSGTCAALLRSLLIELHRDNVPLASLYASTQRLYRSVGFEHAGVQTHYSIPLSSITANDRSMPVHRFDSPPIDRLNSIANARAMRCNGNLSRTDGLWQRLIVPYDGVGTTTYLLGNLDSPEGFAILKGGTRDAGIPQPLVSNDVAANSVAACRRLLTLIRDHRSMCDAFEWFGPPNDPMVMLADEQWVTVKHWMLWMLRIIDLPAALSQRGYSPSLEGTLHLEIDDEVLPENAGRWQVHVADGKASVESGGEGHLRMDIRALAPLFSSHHSAETLIAIGAVEADDEEQIKLATRIFAGSDPWMPEVF